MDAEKQKPKRSLKLSNGRMVQQLRPWTVCGGIQISYSPWGLRPTSKIVVPFPSSAGKAKAPNL